MPIYEYQCTDCGHRLEKLQKITDAPLTDCPDCGTGGLKKLVSAAAFRLKGSGWYETDFKQDKTQKNLAKPDEEKPSSDKDKGKDAKTGDGKDKSDTGSKKDSAAADSTSRAGETKTTPAKKTTGKTDTD